MQVAFEIVQRNTFAPSSNAVKPEVGELVAPIVPVPDTLVHRPVPTDGVLPARVALEMLIL